MSRGGLMLMLMMLVTTAAPAAARPRAADTLTVVTFNIWNDQHDWPRRLPRIVAGLRALRPDVLCLQEVLQNPALPNQAATLADSLGGSWYFASVDGPERPKRYGDAILTRTPALVSAQRELVPRDDYRVAAHVRIAWRGHELDLYDTHLHHTVEGGAIRAAQIRDLLAFVDSTRGGGPWVVAGDFNAELGSPELAPLEAACRDAFATTHPGASHAETVTLNASLGNAPLAIDHVFVPRDPAAGLVPVSAAIVFRDPGPDSVWASDHFGVVARIAVAAPVSGGGSRGHR